MRKILLPHPETHFPHLTGNAKPDQRFYDPTLEGLYQRRQKFSPGTLEHQQLTYQIRNRLQELRQEGNPFYHKRARFAMRILRTLLYPALSPFYENTGLTPVLIPVTALAPAGKFDSKDNFYLGIEEPKSENASRRKRILWVISTVLHDMERWGAINTPLGFNLTKAQGINDRVARIKRGIQSGRQIDNTYGGDLDLRRVEEVILSDSQENIYQLGIATLQDGHNRIIAVAQSLAPNIRIKHMSFLPKKE